MTPGYDFIDVMKKFVWKRFFRNESPNFTVGFISFLGLAADAGYLSGPAGVAANIMVGALKVLSKLAPEPVLKFIVRGFESVLKGIMRLGEVMRRAPGAGVVEKLSRVLGQCDKALKSPIRVTQHQASETRLKCIIM